MERKTGTKQVIILLAAFAVCFFVGDRLLARVLGFAIDYSTLPHARLYSDRGKADVLVFGNSRAFRHFDTKALSEKLGVQVANYSILGGSMELMSVFLKDYIDRYGPPKAIIVEPSCLNWDNSQLKNLRVLNNRSDRLAALTKQEFPKLYYAGVLSHLFRFNGTQYLSILHKVVKPFRQEFLSGTVPTDKMETILTQEWAPYFWSRFNNEPALESVLGLAQKHNINVEVIITPVFSQYMNTRKEFPEWLKALKEKIEPFGSVSDFSHEIEALSYFRDAVHLNGAGVALFTQILQEKGVLARLQ